MRITNSYLPFGTDAIVSSEGDVHHALVMPLDRAIELGIVQLVKDERGISRYQLVAKLAEGGKLAEKP